MISGYMENNHHDYLVYIFDGGLNFAAFATNTDLQIQRLHSGIVYWAFHILVLPMDGEPKKIIYSLPDISTSVFVFK